jgi:hypothetical protein
MEGKISIKNHSYLSQGTSAFMTPLTQSLRQDYFKPEPRSIKYWLIVIQELSQEDFDNGANWSSLIPSYISLDLLAEYIENPKKTIAAGRFDENELEDLREPQRILLFYFLKKISSLKTYNEKIIEEINDILAREVFLQTPLKAVPDFGYGVIPYAKETSILVSEELLLDAVVEEELITRKYISTSPLNGILMNLNRCIMGFPVNESSNKLRIRDQEIPVLNRLYPFRDKEVIGPDEKPYYFTPSLIISSSLLFLREGIRTINLSIKLNIAEELDKSESFGFQFRITTEAGWVRVIDDDEHPSITINKINSTDDSVQYQIIFERDFPPIAPILVPHSEEAIVSEKCCLMIYMEDKSFDLDKIDLSVEVEGLNPVAIRNQVGVLDPKGNYGPFGPEAGLQSVFSFGHPELMHSELETVTATAEWASLPNNLTKHYQAYRKTEEQFRIKIRTALKNPDAVNHNVIDTGESALFVNEISFNPNTEGLKQNTGSSNWNFEELDPLLHNVYYQFELYNQDFGVGQYPLLMTQYSIDLNAYESAKLTRKKREKPVPVNAPYVPMLSNLKINYKTGFETWQSGLFDYPIDIYKNEPKGYSIYKGGEVSLGQNANGVIYFGFENLNKNSTGVLYFNGRSGNARAEQANIKWWYLADRLWNELAVIHDGTNGLTEEGMLTWKTDSDCSNSNPLMPKGTYWLKCTLSQDEVGERTPNDNCQGANLSFRDSIIQLTGIYANAFSFERQQAELDITDNVVRLPRGTTMTFTKGEPAQKVLVPFYTKGGVDRETELEFWARVFNRVRNKDRMVTCKDIEDILLHQFRNLALVKCIPRSQGGTEVSVIVINQQVYGDLPYTMSRFLSLSQLQEVQNEMIALCSAFYGPVIKLRAKNPCYRRVGFKVHLQYERATIESENEVLLHEALCRFVTPWMYEKNKAPQFGIWFEYSELVAHIQSLSFVKYVIDIGMGDFSEELLADRITMPFMDDEILIVGSPHTIIVENDLSSVERTAIGTMEIDKNFIVRDKDGNVPPENSENTAL